MFIELKITAENTQEFDILMARFAPAAKGEAEEPQPARGSTAEEAETPLEPAATKTRQRKPKDEPAPDAGSSTAPDASTTGAQLESETASDEHPLLVSKTLADVKALGNKKVSELGAGPIQQLLVESFGVRNFGSLDAADLDRAYAALEALK